jgi:dolichol kinase
MIRYADTDLKAVLVTLMVILVWLEMVEFSERSKLFDNKYQRKILHICTGPMLLITWTLFTNGTKGAIAAAIVPFLLSVKFYLIGTGKWVDDDTIEIIARKGQRKELLKGPMFYGLVVTLATILFWKSIRGIICILVLCFGDGFAELVGDALGKSNPLPWSVNKKSFAGFVAFILFGISLTWLYVSNVSEIIFHENMPADYNEKLFLRIVIDVLVAAAVETLPVVDYDNFTVFIATALSDIVIGSLL